MFVGIPLLPILALAGVFLVARGGAGRRSVRQDKRADRAEAHGNMIRADARRAQADMLRARYERRHPSAPVTGSVGGNAAERTAREARASFREEGYEVDPVKLNRKAGKVAAMLFVEEPSPDMNSLAAYFAGKNRVGLTVTLHLLSNKAVYIFTEDADMQAEIAVDPPGDEWITNVLVEVPDDDAGAGGLISIGNIFE